MAGACDATFSTANGQVRRGAEAREGIPAAEAAMIYDAVLTDTDLGDALQGVIDNPNIRASGAQPVPLAGSAVVDGTTNAAPDADSYLPTWASMLRNADPTETLPGGAFRTVYGRSRAASSLCAYSNETNRGDTLHTLVVGTKGFQGDLTLAVDAAPTMTLLEQGQFKTEYDEAVVRATTNPATGDLRLRGNPTDWIDRAAGNAGDVYAKLIDLAPNPQGQSIATFYAITGRPGALAGSWTVGAGTDTWTGTGGADDKVAGDVFYSDTEVLFEIATVASGDVDAFTTTATNTPGAAGVTLTREYGAAAAASITPSPCRAGLNTTNGLNRWNEINESSGGQMGDLKSIPVEKHLTSTAGIVAGTIGALTGTVTVTAGSDVVTGAGTNFVADTRRGDFVDTPLTLVLGRRVIEITSATVMRVDSVYGTNETTVTMNRRPIPQINLAGTYTTASDDTIVGSGGNLTTLQPGAWFRTIGGEVRRLLVITDDDNATVTRDFGSTEAAVACTTDVEWRVDREREDWATIEHISGIFPVLRTKVEIRISTEGSEEEEIGVESLTFSFLAGFIASLVTNSPWATRIRDSGNSTGTMTIVSAKDSTTFRKVLGTQERAHIKVLLRSSVLIATSGIPYSWEFILNVKAGGAKPFVIPDATTNQTQLVGTLHDDDTQTDGFTDQISLVVIGDDPTPLPIS